MTEGSRLRSVLAVAALSLAAAAAGCNPILAVNDTVRMEGRGSLLMAYAEREDLFGRWQPVNSVLVTFYADGREVGQERTDGNGLAAIRVPLPPDSRKFSAQGKVLGKDLEGHGTVYQWPAGRTLVVCDIDWTISRTNYGELFVDMSNEGSTPIDGARETLRQLTRDYNVGYLSARPRHWFDLTKQWLAENDFPPGPLITSATINQGLEAEQFKTRTLRKLREHHPEILIGLGDMVSDSEAYAANGMLPLIRHDTDDREFRAHAILFVDWATIREFFRVNADVLQDPQALARAIESGYPFRRPSFPYQPRD